MTTNLGPPNAAQRLPGNPGLRLWCLTVLLAAVILVAVEIMWRFQGFVPSVTDEPALWAVQRARIRNAAPETVVLLGRSRMLQSFVPEVFSEALPDWQYVQLAVDGKHPLGILRDIAEETPYAGVVVCNVTMPSLLPELWDQQQTYLDYFYTQYSPLTHLARATKSAFQTRMVFLLPNLRLHEALPDLLRSKLARQFVVMHPDRVQEVDYGKLDIQRQSGIRMHDLHANYGNYLQLPGATRWPRDLPTINSWVQKIQARGGRVVFLFPPLSGEYQATQEAYMPRGRYWDVFARMTSAVAIHAEDVAGLRDIVCAEGSHLYREDCVTFTRVLVRELQERGILFPPSTSAGTRRQS